MRAPKFKHFTPSASVDATLGDLHSKSAIFWEKQGEKMALSLFKYTRDTVSAYAQFLKKHKAPDVKSISDFKKLPLVSKKNYLRKSEYTDLFPRGSFSTATTISATSGSTGEPFYFPRSKEHDAQYERMAEIFLKNQFQIDKKRTLGIIGFGLGIWIGGMFTYKNFNRIAEKGYDFTLIPVGANKDLYLKAFKKFAPMYDQVILMGYPPFVKDILDNGKDYGIDWKKHDIKILTAAEGYSENFRNYIAEKAGIKNFFSDIINMYGTVEQGTLAHETSFANLIRNIASKDEKVFKKLFPNAKNIPTFAQYYPHTVYFEEENGVVVATGYGSSIPLVRYAFSDLGGVIRFDDVVLRLKECGIDILEEARKQGIDKQILRLPFVYLYARSDFSVVFRGANIYPEEIRVALDSPKLNKFLTGRATIIRREDHQFNQILEVHVELKKNLIPDTLLKNKILDQITEHLCAHNSEYNYLHSVEPNKVMPTIICHEYQTTSYFAGTGKQAWVGLK